VHRIAQRLAGAYTITATATDDEGVALTLTDPVTAVVTDGAGTVVDVAADPSAAAGVLSLDIAYDEIPLLDTYTVVWTAPEGTWRTSFELVGGFLCEIADIRAEPLIRDGGTITTADLRKARTKAEEHIERLAMCAFVPRGARQTLIVDCEPFGALTKLTLENVTVRRVYSVTIDGVALTAPELAALTVYSYGTIVRESGWPDDSVVQVHYEHGADEAPGAILEGCSRLAARYALKNQLGGRRTLESTDMGTMRVTYGTRAGETGDADLDAAIADFGHRMPVVG